MSDLLLLYIRDRFGKDAAGKESELLTTVRKEIYSAIVSLFDIRMRNAVEISFNSGPTFYRTEIFDDRLLVSLFIGKTATAYPATYLYRKDTFYYEVFMKDFLQARELSVGNVRFDLKTTERGLTQFLQFIDCPYCSDLRVLRRGAEEGKRGFISHL